MLIKWNPEFRCPFLGFRKRIPILASYLYKQKCQLKKLDTKLLWTAAHAHPQFYFIFETSASTIPHDKMNLCFLGINRPEIHEQTFSFVHLSFLITWLFMRSETNGIKDRWTAWPQGRMFPWARVTRFAESCTKLRWVIGLIGTAARRNSKTNFLSELAKNNTADVLTGDTCLLPRPHRPDPHVACSHSPRSPVAPPTRGRPAAAQCGTRGEGGPVHVLG